MDIFFLMRSDLTNNKQQLIYLFPLPNDSPFLVLDKIVDLLQTIDPGIRTSVITEVEGVAKASSPTTILLPDSSVKSIINQDTLLPHAGIDLINPIRLR
jgi:hypothetical protein